MKTPLVIFGVIAASGIVVAIAQQPAQPQPPTSQPQREPPRAEPPPIGTPIPRPPNVPPGRDTPILPPGRAFNMTNPPPGRPFRTNFPPAFATNGVGFATNEFGNANIADTNSVVLATNTIVFTNSSISATQTMVVFAVTNTLSRMAQPQAASVYQVQTALSTLQRSVASLAAIPDVQTVLQQNPQLQQQLSQLETQIATLARGPIRPSAASVQRLSRDLFVVTTPVARQSTADHHLVLSVLINTALNSANLAPAQIEGLLTNVQLALQSTGVPPDQSQIIASDLQTIIVEIRQQ
jgi:hypothetical protein